MAEDKQRILRTLDSDMLYKALRRVTNRLAVEPDGDADVLNPYSIEQALEEEYQKSKGTAVRLIGR